MRLFTLHLFLAAILATAAAAAAATDLALYSDGSSRLVDMVQTELEFSEGEGTFRVSDFALSRIAHIQGDEYRVLLKDGSELQGTLLTRLELNEGMVIRHHPPGAVKHLEFDVFLDPSVAGQREQCPIRILRPIPQLLTKERSWWDSGLRRIECKELRLSVVEFKKSKRPHARIRDAEGREASLHNLYLNPSLWLRKGEDRYVEVSISLRQGQKILATHRRIVEADEGENNSLATVTLQYTKEDLVPDGPTPQILYQLQELPERGTPSKDSASGWFSVWLTHQLIDTIN